VRRVVADERERKPESATVWKDTQHERLPRRMDVEAPREGSSGEESQERA